MAGKPIEMIENCINEALINLKSNPQLLESGRINIFSFGNNKVSFLLEWKSLNNIGLQNYSCSGYSNINYGLEAVKENYQKNFIKTTTEKKGDWKPMLFVFTGIAPSSKIDISLIDFFEKNYSHGYLDYIENFVGEKLEYVSDKANNIFIVTSENEFTKNSFKNYFTNVFSYQDKDLFIHKFNNFFK
jgi:uncharacterized protein YegL